MDITFCPHIYCASLNCHVSIAFFSHMYSVDYSHNVGIAFCPTLKNNHVAITFRVLIYNVN